MTQKTYLALSLAVIAAGLFLSPGNTPVILTCAASLVLLAAVLLVPEPKEIET